MKQSRTFQYIITIIIFLVLGIVAIGYFFKGSASAASLRKSMGIADSEIVDTISSAAIEKVQRSNSKLGSEFFKFRTNYDTLFDESKLDRTINTINEISLGSEQLTQIDTAKVHPDSLTKMDTVNVETDQNSKSNTINQLATSDSKGNEFELGLQNLNELDQIPRKSILKILAVCAKNLLLNDNIEDSELIILSICETQNISNVIVTDKTQSIRYSNDKKLLGQKMQLQGKASQNEEGIICEKVQEIGICTMPVFHIYGRLGNVYMFYQ